MPVHDWEANLMHVINETLSTAHHSPIYGFISKIIIRSNHYSYYTWIIQPVFWIAVIASKDFLLRPDSKNYNLYFCWIRKL